jgi:hypothetical protein
MNPRAPRAPKERFTYSKLDEMFASTTEPIEEDKRTYHLLRIYEGLNRLETTPEPAYNDWLMCSDAVNMMQSLLELGAVEDKSGLIPDAVQALARAGYRHLDGKVLRLDGLGLQAVRSVINDYAEALDLIPKRTIIRAHRHAETRLQQIRQGKLAPQDVRLPRTAK